MKLLNPLFKIALCAAAMTATLATADLTDGDTLDSGTVTFSGTVVPIGPESSCAFDSPTVNIDLGTWDRFTDDGNFEKGFPVRITGVCDGGRTGLWTEVAPAQATYRVDLSDAGSAQVSMYTQTGSGDTCTGSLWSDATPSRMPIPANVSNTALTVNACARIDQVTDDAAGTLSLSVPYTVKFKTLDM